MGEMWKWLARVAGAVAVFVLLTIVIGFKAHVGISDAMAKGVSVLVFAAGLLNFAALRSQVRELRRSGKAEGQSMGMYALFLFIQFAFAANGVIHHDPWQVFGMGISMVPTLQIMRLIDRFRTPSS